MCNHFCCRFAPFTWICESKRVNVNEQWNYIYFEWTWCVFFFHCLFSSIFLYTVDVIVNAQRAKTVYLVIFHFWEALFVLIRLCILLLLLFLSDNIQKWLAILFGIVACVSPIIFVLSQRLQASRYIFQLKETWISCSISIWWAVVCLIFMHSISFIPKPSTMLQSAPFVHSQFRKARDRCDNHYRAL